MRFSHVAVIYFLMGAIVVGANVVPVTQLGVASVFVDTDGQDVAANETSVGGDGSQNGMLDNLIGPVKNALNTITGGALLAVWGPISLLTGFYAWPVVTTTYIGAPFIVQMLSGVFVASFTFGVLRVFRASI
jgi:hypothetical protein